jgi:pyruvate-formate lyase
MGNDGSHIQYNMVDTNELKDAKVNPEKHKDLIVRIGGFSAYLLSFHLVYRMML